MNHPIIIVGTGLAGVSTARELRKHDADTPLVMLTADDGRVYSKPMLSNAFAKSKDAASLATADATGLGEQLNATVHARTRVVAIDPAAHTLTTDTGLTLTYSKLVLALGATQIRVPVDGNAIANIHSVNDLMEYADLRERLEGQGHVTIMGAGLIGCEFANDFAHAGIKVELVDLAATPLSRLMPRLCGNALRHGLESLGVKLHMETVVSSVDHSDCGGYTVTLKDGTRIGTDLVLSAIGLRPNLDLAKAAGLTVNRGVVVDRQLQTSAPDIYCLGDCMEIETLVLPYIMPIMHQARTLGPVLAGKDASLSYPAMPVLVKTPVHPVIVAPPPIGAAGDWTAEGDDTGTKALFRAPDGALLGFALTGDCTKERAALGKELPPVLA